MRTEVDDLGVEHANGMSDYRVIKEQLTEKKIIMHQLQTAVDR